MFLSKRSNGVYYLWYDDDSGKRQKVSTKTNSKAEANQFLREFIKNGRDQKVRIASIPQNISPVELKAVQIFFVGGGGHG